MIIEILLIQILLKNSHLIWSQSRMSVFSLESGIGKVLKKTFGLHLFYPHCLPLPPSPNELGTDLLPSFLFGMHSFKGLLPSTHFCFEVTEIEASYRLTSRIQGSKVPCVHDSGERSV